MDFIDKLASKGTREVNDEIDKEFNEIILEARKVMQWVIDNG